MLQAATQSMTCSAATSRRHAIADANDDPAANPCGSVRAQSGCGLIERRQHMGNLLIACIVVWTSIGNAQAQIYPSRPITMVVPLPAGSAFDVTARILAERMQISLGQPVIIENLTGASGSIGTGRCARAAPDGYTLCFGGVGTHVLDGAVLALPYDVVNDFEPLSLIASAQLLVVAKKTMPANNLKDLIGWLKAHPGKASQGTGGQGSLTHFVGVSFRQETGTQFRSVPYRGAGAAINDLVAGHLDIMFDLAPNSLPHVRAGTIKAFAVLAKTRLTAAPDIPTVDEAGLAGFYMSAWQALWAPKGIPMPMIDKLNAAIVDAVADPAVGSRFSELGQDIFPREQQTPEALRALQKAEIEKWWPLIKAANASAE
jgi:tripartite-type tricarboxylate transporter receptor subunit TctC